MTCCTPQDRPEAKEASPTTGVDGDTETRDMEAFSQKCQDMFSDGMPDCCARMGEQTHTEPSED